MLALRSYLSDSQNKLDTFINFFRNDGAIWDIEDMTDFRSSFIFYLDSIKGI